MNDPIKMEFVIEPNGDLDIALINLLARQAEQHRAEVLLACNYIVSKLSEPREE
jgi:hypothetical protein